MSGPITVGQWIVATLCVVGLLQLGNPTESAVSVVIALGMVLSVLAGWILLVVRAWRRRGA
jgi:uncharacterized membrane protein HdeD (DUF308 family)